MKLNRKQLVAMIQEAIRDFSMNDNEGDVVLDDDVAGTSEEEELSVDEFAKSLRMTLNDTTASEDDKNDRIGEMFRTLSDQEVDLIDIERAYEGSLTDDLVQQLSAESLAANVKVHYPNYV